MKHAALLSLFVCGLVLPAAEWVHRGNGERFASGDFNGNGTPDLVIAHEESGEYHIIYRLPGGDIASPGRISGAPGFTGMAVGRVKTGPRDVLLLAAPDLNRIQLLDNAVQTAPASPESIGLDGIGPHEVLAIETMGDSTTSEADLFVFSAWNGNNPYLYERVEGGSLQPLGFPQGGDRIRDGNPLRIKIGEPQYLAFVREDFSGDEHLRIVEFTPGGAILPVLDQPMPAEDMRFAYGFFNGSTTGSFVFWLPGENEIHFAGLDSADTPMTFTAQQTFGGFPNIRLVQILDHSTGRLLVTSTDGLLFVYDFDGISAPVWIQQINPPPGAAQITGAIPLADGSFALLHNSEPGGRTAGVHHMELIDGTYQSVSSLALSPAPRFRGANLIVYDADPFVAPSPRRLYSGFVPDWTLTAGKQSSQIYVTRSLDAGPMHGLSAAPPLVTGLWPVEADGTLTNQMEPDISVITTDATLGSVSSDLRIIPHGGSFDRAVRIELTAVPPGSPVRYRTADNGVWVTYTEPFWIAWPTTLQAFTEPADGIRGPVRTAEFTFTRPLEEMDSDGDGVPDFVEILYGLDPTAGADTDGDGISDFEELITGFNPAVPDNPGDNFPRPFSVEVFDLIIKPLGINGMPEPTPAAEGVTLRARTLNGGVIGQDITAAVPRPKCPSCGDDPTVYISGLTVDRDPPLLLLSTPANFPLLGDIPDMPEGRELLKFFRLPELEPIEVNYTYQGLSLAAEAAAWIAAATTAAQEAQRLVLYTEINPVDTLAALFLENLVYTGLNQRGHNPLEFITLFPHRPLDAARFAPSPEQLRALRRPGPPGAAVFRIEDQLESLETFLNSADPLAVDLREFVTVVYQTSAMLAYSMPGEYDPPVEVIRHWINTATVPERYLNYSILDESEVGELHIAAKPLFLTPENRPVETIPLTAGVPSEGCSVFLDTLGGSVALLDERGRPFTLPISFGIAPGASLTVTGFSDVTSDCAPVALEVISLTLESVPLQFLADLNGNLMPDAWELLVFGQAGGLHTLDSDGDGYSDLQEFLDGSDPRDPLSTPAGPPVDLGPPEVELVMTQDGITVEWNWPEGYQHFFTFRLQSTENLNTPFQNAVSLEENDGNRMRLVPAAPLSEETNRVFHRISISLE